MKYIVPFSFLAVAVSVDAAALAGPEAEPWCFFRGQSCWKVKRAAEAFTNSLQTSGPTIAFANRAAAISQSVGGAAYEAKRQIDSLALAIALSQKDPSEFYQALNLASAFPPDSPKPDANATDKRDIEADKRWCFFRGQPCWKAKRAAEAVVDAIGHLDVRDAPFASEVLVRRNAEAWCFFRGQSCWKRASLAEAECNAPGGPCTEATRDLQAMYSAAQDILDVE